MAEREYEERRHYCPVCGPKHYFVVAVIEQVETGGGFHGNFKGFRCKRCGIPFESAFGNDREMLEKKSSKYEEERKNHDNLNF